MLCSFEELTNWELLIRMNGKDLAVEIREYFIPDFSQWKMEEKFQASIKKLIQDLNSD